MARKKRGKLAKVPKPSKHVSHSRKHKKSNKSLWAVSIFAFFVFAFLVGVSNNSSQPQVTGNAFSTPIPGGGSNIVESKGTFIGDFFANWATGSLDINIAKYLFWVIVLMIIADVLGFMNFPRHGFLRFILALVVSFLAVAFITPAEVFVLLISYSALGLMLATILPFVLVLFTSTMLVGNAELAQRGGGLGKMILEIMIWVMFSGFMIYRLVTFAAANGIMALVNSAGIVLAVVTLLSLAILFFNKHFRRWMQKLGLDMVASRTRAEEQARIAEIRAAKIAEKAESKKAKGYNGGF